MEVAMEIVVEIIPVVWWLTLEWELSMQPYHKRE
jgi:hypothetical protein